MLLLFKVMVNKEDAIPDEVVVSPGDSPRAPSWTVPIFILHASDVEVMGDEDALPPEGPLHPLSAPAPHWMESAANVFQAHANSRSAAEDTSVGNAQVYQSSDHAAMDALNDNLLCFELGDVLASGNQNVSGGPVVPVEQVANADGQIGSVTLGWWTMWLLLLKVRLVMSSCMMCLLLMWKRWCLL